MFEAKAHLKDTNKFIERLEWGLEAQSKVQKALEDRGIKPMDIDERKPIYTKIDNPKPDLEYRQFFLEVRRQEFYDTVLLGYTKKYDGWMYHSINKNKLVFFLILNNAMDETAITLLNDKEPGLRTNKAGDVDYTLPFDEFKVLKFDECMDILAKILV